MSCGYHHTVAATLDGTMYAWGSGGCGQLGIEGKGIREVLSPVVIEALAGKKVLRVPL